jgi:hypothetical protein
MCGHCVGNEKIPAIVIRFRTIEADPDIAT